MMMNVMLYAPRILICESRPVQSWRVVQYSHLRVHDAAPHAAVRTRSERDRRDGHVHAAVRGECLAGDANGNGGARAIVHWPAFCIPRATPERCPAKGRARKGSEQWATAWVESRLAARCAAGASWALGSWPHCELSGVRRAPRRLSLGRTTEFRCCRGSARLRRRPAWRACQHRARAPSWPYLLEKSERASPWPSAAPPSPPPRGGETRGATVR